MRPIFLQLRLIHAAFLVTWFLFVFVLKVANPTERLLPPMVLAAFAVVAVSIVLVGLKLRQQFLHIPASALATEPEDTRLLQRWRVGNLMSLCFAENPTLLGVVLKFLGASWNVVAVFFALGLILLILWTPRQIQPMPRGVR